MRSGDETKKSVAFACVVNSKTFKRKQFQLTNHSELFKFVIVATNRTSLRPSPQYYMGL